MTQRIDVLTGVVSSSAMEARIATPAPTAPSTHNHGCPRVEALGMACIGSAYGCLCRLVTAWEKEYDLDAQTLLLTLYMPKQMGAAAAILQHLDLLPFQILPAVGPDAVTVSFNLTRPRNSELSRRLRNPGD